MTANPGQHPGEGREDGLRGVTCDFGNPPCSKWSGHAGDHGRSHVFAGIADAVASLASPRENGWEELRREIEALPDVNPTPTLHAGAHTDWPMVKRADVLRLLAAARGEPGLDVERLARALGPVLTYERTAYGTDEEIATAIAAEYERLGSE